MTDSRYKHIIWDWNGTLLDDVNICHEIANRVMLEMGHPGISIERYKETFQHPITEFYRTNGVVLSDAEYMEFSLEFHSRYRLKRPEIGLHKDVELVLKELHQQGKTHSIVSAHPQDLLDFSVRAAGLLDFFVKIHGLVGVAAHSKVELAKDWFKQLPHDANEVVMIGDTNHDFEVSQALGIDCVLIANGFQSRAVLERTTAPVINSLSELLQHLREN